MAFRRKSARPMNKLRHQVMEEEDNDDDGVERGGNNDNLQTTCKYVPAMLSAQCLEATGKDILLHVNNQSNIITMRNRNAIGRETKSPAPLSMVDPVHEQSNIPMHESQKIIGRETASASPSPLLTTRPFLALPSDIYRDFENLKSATRLDTTGLMRKLLQDYTRLSEGHQRQRSQTQSGEENGLTTNPVLLMSPCRPDSEANIGAEVLDLSANASGRSKYGTSVPTDDQIAMKTVASVDKICDGDGVCTTESDRIETEEEVAPLDLSMGSKQEDDASLLFTRYVSVTKTDLSCNRGQFEGRQQQYPQHQQCMYAAHDAVYTLSPDTENLSALLNQNTRQDNSTSPTFLSTSEGITSNCPTKSYVIDLEPSRSPTLTPSTSQPESQLRHVINTLHEHRNDAKYLYDCPARSKLFSSFPVSKETGQPCLVFQSQQECDFSNHPKVSLDIGQSPLIPQNSTNSTIGSEESHKILDSLYKRENQEDPLEEKIGTLPSYSEAISSIAHSKSQHTKPETDSTNLRDDAQSNVIPAHFLSSDEVKLLHSDHQIDVRFVPYSSLARLASPDATGPDTDNPQGHHILLQKILEHQQNLFTTSPQHLSSRHSVNSKNVLLNNQQKSTFTLQNEGSNSTEENSVEIAHGTTETLPCKPKCDFLSDTAHTRLVARTTNAENEAAATTVAKVITSPQLSLSNFLVDSKAIVFAPTSEGGRENPSHATRTSGADSTVSETSTSLLPGVPAAYLMAQSGTLNDSLGGMLAIPVINGGNLPSVLTGFQPFAFAPNTVVSQSLSNEILQPESSRLKQQSNERYGVDVLQNKADTDREKNMKSPQYVVNNEALFTISNCLETSSENNVFLQEVNNAKTGNQQDLISPVSNTQNPDLKPKPGRPRGRGGRNGGKGAVGKEMKLLTENTLFPGVYTSILKLPWSRRSRNKAKSKTVSQMRKEAQAIALAQEKHEKSLAEKPAGNFLSERNSELDVKVGTEYSHLVTNDNNRSRLIAPGCALQQNTNDHEQTSAIGLNTDIQKQQQLETESDKGTQEGKTHFPRLDEVLHQSYALQQTLQRKEDVKQGLQESTNRNSLFEDIHKVNGLKSQLFRSAGSFTQSGLNAAQIQKNLESSLLFPSTISTLHTTDADQKWKSREREQQNKHCSTPCDQKEFSPSLIFQNSILSNCFEAGQLSGKKRFSSPPGESNVEETHKRRGRPSKSVLSVEPNIETLGSVPNEEFVITTSSPSSALLGTSPRFIWAEEAGAKPNLTTSDRSSSNDINQETEELTLEKKIYLLTQQIGLEMSQSLVGLNKTTQKEKSNTMLEVSTSSTYISCDTTGQNSTPTIAGILNQPRCDTRLHDIKGFGKLGLNHISKDKTETTTEIFVPGSSLTSENQVSDAMTSSIPISALNQEEPVVPKTTKTEPTPTPRRKKVSRLLKSDENFMYATFKIKPKGGLTPRKPRRKRKASELTRDRSVEADTKKKLQVSLTSAAESSALEQSSGSTILWKFHEQYATAGVEDGDGNTVSQPSASLDHGVCATCGKLRTQQGGLLHEVQCCKCLEVESVAQMEQGFSSDTILSLPFPGNASQPRDPNSTPATNKPKYSGIPPSKVSYSTNSSNGELIYTTENADSVQTTSEARGVIHPDITSVSCMTCGKAFHKFYSDPRGSCDACLSTIPRVISSSKLFSLSDPPSEALPNSIASSNSSSFSSNTTVARVTLSSTKLPFSPTSSKVILSTTSPPTPSIFSEASLSQSFPADLDKSGLNGPLKIVSSDTPGSLIFSSSSKTTMFKADNLNQDDSSFPLSNISDPSLKVPKVTSLVPPITSVSYVPVPPPGVSVLTANPESSKVGVDNPINNVKFSGNNLYCSLCRMKFAKICDYLSHVRQVHEKEKKSPGSGILYSFIPSKYNTGNCTFLTSTSKRPTKNSKTKKSLAHKTLTCPVEDCPHFFREHKEMSLHFLRKHPHLSLCPHQDCIFTCKEHGHLQNHIALSHDRNHGNCDDSVRAELSRGVVGVELGDEKEVTSDLFRKNISENPDVLNLNGLNSNCFEDDAETVESKPTSFEDEDLKATDLTDASDTSNNGNNHVTSSDQSMCEKPLQCDFCDYRCRQKNALSWHMRKHPEAAGQYRKYSVKSE